MKNNKLKVIIIVVLVAILGSLATLALVNRNKGNDIESDTKISYNPPTTSEKKEGEETKLEQTDKPDTPSGEVQPAEGRLEISSAKQDSAKSFVVQTKLYDVTWKQCTLTLTRKNLSIAKTVDTLFNSDFSTCMGFKIDSSEFAEGGTWSMTLSAERTDGKIKTTSPQTVSITK